jgi:hypothetical protein
MTGTIRVLIFIGSIAGSIGLVIFLQWLGVIPSRYPLVYFDDKGILLKRRRGLTKLLTWSEITSIFPFGFVRRSIHDHHYHNFCFELIDGRCIGFYVVDKNVSEVLENLQDSFLENLKKAGRNIESYDFSHPKRWVKSKKRYLILHTVMSVCAIILSTIIGIISFKGLGPYLFPFPFVFILTILLTKEWLLNRSHRCLISLKFNNKGQLFWQDEFGQTQTRMLSNIKSFELDKIKGYLEFSDGTRLTDLEKLRYWPLLREYLLSKLEPSEKTSD